MNKRYIGAIILLPLLIFIFVGGMMLKYGVMILSLGGLYEFYKVSKKKNIKPISIIGYILTLIYYFLIGEAIYSELLIGLLVMGTLIMLCITVLDTEYNFIDVAITLLGFFFIPVFFSFITLVNMKPFGNYLVWFIFLASWLCDTAAYYSGRHFGKHKLCPKVSPKKTIEGSIGGFIGSILSCGIFGIIINNTTLNIPIYNYFIIGGLCGILCQFGDLVASSIKRNAGVKDYSNLIPGHGGILDRFDSILFAALVVYYYIGFILGM